MAARALPLAKTPPGPFGRPPHQPGPLLATAVCVGPVSGGGAVAGTLALGTASQPVQPGSQAPDLVHQPGCKREGGP